MSAVMKRKKHERQSSNQAPARHSGEGRNPPTSSFRTPHSGDPESSFPVPLETVALAPLGEVVDINPRFGKDELADDMLASFVPMKCVEEESGRFAPLEDRKVGEVRKGYTSFRDGDVIFAKVTPCMENGKAAVVSGLTNGVGFGSTEFFVLRPSERIDPKYLLHFVLQQNFRKEAARNMTGAVGLRRVPKSWLEQQRIPLPSIAAQRQIVADIEKQFTRLDAGVAALRRVQANLKRYRAAVLKAACEGRLVPTEAELAKAEGRNYETAEQLLARILADRRKNWHGRGKYKEPATPDTTNLPPLPRGWAWASVEQLADIGSGNTPANISDYAKPAGAVPWFKVGDMNRIGNEQIMRSAEAYLRHEDVQALGLRLFSSGTIVFPKRGGAIATNKKRLLEAAATTDLNVMGLTPDVCVLGYFKHWFASVDLASLSDGSNVPQVNNKDIQPLRVPLPPLAEQTRIVAEVERRLSVIEELEAAVTANLQRATRLRQSVLQQAFTSR